MSDDSNRAGQVSSTPEAGPIAEGTPAWEPGAGQVQSTPEAGPLSEGDELKPPSWREQMAGPILGLDDAPTTTPGREQPAAQATGTSLREERAGEPQKWPPHRGKPVSEANWQEIGRYVAPVASQAEKLAIQAIDLSARGLSRLARYLESRRQERDGK